MAEQFPPESSVPESEADDSSSSSPAAGRPWWRPLLLAGFAGFVLLALGTSAIYVLMQDTTRDEVTRSGTSPASPASRSRQANADANQPASIDAERQEQARAAEQRAIRLAKLERFTTLRDRVDQKLKQLAIEMASWEKLLGELLDGEAGRHIATDTTYVERFLPVYQGQPITHDEYESFQRRFTKLADPISGAENDASYIPSDTLLTELNQLEGEASSALNTMQTNRKFAEALRRLAASRPASEKTLRIAIDEFLKQQQDDRLEQIAAARRKAEEETTALLAQKALEQEELRRDVELARLAGKNAELADEKTRLEAEALAAAKERQIAAERAALKREFQRDLTEIKSLLRPFISNGMTQPKRNGFEPANEEGPVSLGRLRGTGALEPTVNGRQTLYWITTANRMNDRELGSFPSYGGGAADWQAKHPTIKRAQELLIKYGDLLVDEQMLSK